MPASTSAPDRALPVPIPGQPGQGAGEQVVEPSLAALAGQAIEDAREAVAAEIELFRARAGQRVGAYGAAAGFFGAATVVALAALVALLVGLILTLATLIGPGLATLAVVGAALAVAGVLALIGRARLKPPVPGAGA